MSNCYTYKLECSCSKRTIHTDFPVDFKDTYCEICGDDIRIIEESEEEE